MVSLHPGCQDDTVITTKALKDCTELKPTSKEEQFQVKGVHLQSYKHLKDIYNWVHAHVKSFTPPTPPHHQKKNLKEYVTLQLRS